LHAWDLKIRPIVHKLEKEKGKDEKTINRIVPEARQRDYNEFVKAYKSNKSIDIKQYVENLKSKYVIQPKPTANPKDATNTHSGYDQYKSVVSDIAKVVHQMWTKTIQNIKTSNEVKTVQKVCPNYLKYLYDIPSIEKIETEMYDDIKKGHIKSVDDVRYVAYVFDMEGFRDEYPDSYEENPNLQEGLIYDALDNCVPNYSGKYYFEQNCYGWSSITFGIYAS
jgi:hypothetical protein